MLRKFTLVLAMTLLGVLGVASADAYAQDVAQVRMKNTTSATSFSTSYVQTLYANAGDSLQIQLSYLSLGSAQNASFIKITLPADLTYSSTVTSGITTTTNGQEVTFTFTPATTQTVTFNASVKSGNQLSTTHSHTLSFTTNGVPTASTSNGTLNIGPALTTISPSTGADVNATNVTLTGHGFGDSVTSITLNDGTNILPGAATVTAVGDGTYTITGVRIPSGKTTGAYQVKLTISNGGKSMTTGTDTAHTVQFSVTDGTAPIMSTADSYTHSSGILILDFDEAINATDADPSKITLYDASTGGNSLALTGATVAAGSSTDKLSVTLTQSQINTIAGWQAASNLYVQLSVSAVADTTGNTLAAQASRTAIASWTKDSTAPTVSAFSIAQNSVTTTNVYAGTMTISLTLSEVASTSPVISIDQPGTTDISNAVMTTADNTTYTYTYTVVASSTPTYLDGTATVTISGAVDYAGNTMVANNANTFTIDTDTPNPAIADLTATTAGFTSMTLTWTPTYTEADFSTYKIYYRSSTGVTSANGTLVSKATSGQSALGTASTATATITSLSAQTNYFFVIYICDNANNCSPISNETSKATVTQAGNVSVSSGGGGGGGSSSSSAPSISASKSIGTTGGTFSATLNSGASAKITVPEGTFTQSTSVTISAATNTQKSSAPLVSTTGSFVGENIYKMDAVENTTNVSTFSKPLVLEFSYTPSTVTNTTNMRIAYFNTTQNKWIALPTTINSTTGKATASVTHFTLFALINYTSTPEEETTSSSTGTIEDEGTVLGNSTGVYPNGSLLVVQGNPAVWYIQNNQKRLIRSGQIFESRFNWNDVITLPSTKQLDLYTQGDDISFAAGVLVKEEGNSSVYRISAGGGKQPILSLEVFLSRGYNFDNVIEVEPDGLASYPTLAHIEDDSIMDGDLVKLTNEPAVYAIENGATRLIPHYAIFVENAFDFADVRTVDTDTFALLNTGTEMTYPDGTLIKGSDASVYVIADGAKRPIVSGEDFEALLYDWNNIVFVPDVLIARIETASIVQLVQLGTSSVASVE